MQPEVQTAGRSIKRWSDRGFSAPWEESEFTGEICREYDKFITKMNNISTNTKQEDADAPFEIDERNLVSMYFKDGGEWDQRFANISGISGEMYNWCRDNRDESDESMCQELKCYKRFTDFTDNPAESCGDIGSSEYFNASHQYGDEYSSSAKKFVVYDLGDGTVQAHTAEEKTIYSELQS